MARPKADHIAYGRHSKIPECCIQWWVNDFAYESPEFREAFVFFFQEKTRKFPYMPCHECMKKEPVKIHICGEECVTRPYIARYPKLVKLIMNRGKNV